MAGPRLPRNERLQNDKGQVDQRFLRYWDQIKTRAYSAIQSFAEFAQLDTIASVDSAADYLVIYDASEGTANKVLVESIASSGSDLIEAISLTAVSSIVFDDIPQNYSALVVGIDAVTPSSGTVFLQLEFSTDNGSSYATSGVFGSIVLNSGSGALVSIMPTTGKAYAGMSSSSTTASGMAKLDSYASDGTVHKAYSCGTGSANGTVRLIGSGALYGIGAINAIRVSWSSNSFAATGSIRLYGQK